MAYVISKEIIKEIIIQLNIDKNKVFRIVKVCISENQVQIFFNCKNLGEHLFLATHLFNTIRYVNVNITKLKSHCHV